MKYIPIVSFIVVLVGSLFMLISTGSNVAGALAVSSFMAFIVGGTLHVCMTGMGLLPRV